MLRHQNQGARPKPHPFQSVRLKHRQGAEEVAAKTTMKIIFPLVLFIFPSMFMVLLGPAVLNISRGMALMGH